MLEFVFVYSYNFFSSFRSYNDMNSNTPPVPSDESDSDTEDDNRNIEEEMPSEIPSP